MGEIAFLWINPFHDILRRFGPFYIKMKKKKKITFLFIKRNILEVPQKA
jgi:hypothetical protein